MRGVAERLAPFGTTIFAEMTRLADEHGAVNLAQGFPDFDGPGFVKQAAIDAIRAGHAQYARTSGLPALASAIAAWWRAGTGESIDPDTQVTVTSGCTEALCSALVGLVNPGDEVVLFQPFYDSYRACVAMAGGVPRFVTLRPLAGANGAAGAEFEIDEDELRRAFSPRTRAVVLNTPHNPTGKVFTQGELDLVASLAIRHDAVVICDEVYERLTYDPSLPHVSIASLPGMAERTVTCSSLGKTFSLTGWKIGWAIASAALTRGVRAAHQFITFATATPFQHAAATALTNPEPYVSDLVRRYRQSRDLLARALDGLCFSVFIPAGTYFIMADHSRLSARLGLAGDVEFCRFLTTRAGVAAIPPSAFYDDPALGRSLVRFAFCKKHETIAEAVRRLERALRA
jgi:aspartate/methionine/tyrosine aminotransferase